MEIDFERDLKMLHVDFKDEEKGYKPKKADCFWKLENIRNRFFSRVSRISTEFGFRPFWKANLQRSAMTHLYFWPQELDNRLAIQFTSVAQSSPTLQPMNCSTPGLPVHHQLLGFTQTHVHWVGDGIQPSHSLSSPSPDLNLSQHQGLFQWVSSLHEVAKVLEFQLQHQSYERTSRTYLL